MSGLVEFARYSNSFEAGVPWSRLQADGVHCVLFDLNTNSSEGSFMYLPVRLMVLDEDLDEARAALDLGEPPGTSAILQGWRWWMLIWFLFGPLAVAIVLLWFP